MKLSGFGIIAIILSAFLVAVERTSAQNIGVTSGSNYIVSVSPLDAASHVSIGKNTINKPADVKVSVQLQYFDGLGRPLQDIAVGASPLGKDMVIPYTYDFAGREVNQYLPYIASSGNGAYQEQAIVNQQDYYKNEAPVTDLKPWTDISYEASPLNRVSSQYMPGQAWKTAGRPMRTAYKLNVSQITRWKVNPKGAVKDGTYQPGTLFLTETITEDNGLMREYTNQQGKTIRQEKVLDSHTSIIIQYVYDDSDHLTYVIQPKASGITSFNHSDQNFAYFIFAYQYDHRNRIIRKHIPGAGWTSIVYDNADRPVLLQDSVQAAMPAPEWSFTRYDAFGRVIMTGVLKSKVKRSEWADSLRNQTNLYEVRNARGEYSNRCCPRILPEQVYLENYYDHYNFPAGFSADIPSRQTPICNNSQGMITGTKVRILDSNTWLPVVYFYDSKGRLQETVSKNTMDKWDRVVNEYDFTGQLVASTRTHEGNDPSFPSLVIRTEQEYDIAGRPTNTWYQIGATPKILVAGNRYNELGQIERVLIHNACDSFLYTYNIRGWLSSVKGTYFSEVLHYNDTTITGLAPKAQWGGNISAIEWKTPSLNRYWHAYAFNYDKMDRLTKGGYSRSRTEDNTAYGSDSGFHNEEYTYDVNGNIVSLNRRHLNRQIDQLTFSYEGNRISGLGDRTVIDPEKTGSGMVPITSPPQPGVYASCGGFEITGNFIMEGNITFEVDPSLCDAGVTGNTTYNYDVSGRMTNDTQAGTEIIYNHLNLVKQVKKGSKTLKYIYDATGRRLKTIPPSGSARSYMDGIEYKGDVIDFIATPYGRIRKSGNDWVHDYFLRDHLGNNRVVVTTDPVNTQTYMATMEVSKSEEESMYFENLTNTRSDRPYNYPDESPTNAKVAKVAGKSEGPKLTLKVMAGDTISISAQAFYNIDRTLPGQGADIVPVVGSAIATLAGGVMVPAGEAASLALDLGATASTSAALSQLPQDSQEDEGAQPESGLHFVLYNERMDVVEANTGILPVDDRINKIQDLNSDKIVIQESGYLEIFVNNEAQTPVYYDNLMVTQSMGAVLEVNAYYPYGKIIQGLSSSSTYGKNNYKYNGKEMQTDMDLNWLDFGARMMDPVVGRFWVPDPMSLFTPGISPYSISDNNPIRFIDEYGLGPKEWWLAVKDFFAFLVGLRPKGVKLNNGFSNREYQSNRSKSAKSKFKHIDPAPPTPYVPFIHLPTTIDIPDVDINVDIKPVTLSKAHIPIPEKPVPPVISLDIRFKENSSSFYDLKLAELELMKLVKTLQDHPLLKIHITGNTGTDGVEAGEFYGNDERVLNSSAKLNGRKSTVGKLMNARGKAVMDYLYKKGIDSKRMTYGTGVQYNTPVGRKTTIRTK